eukprot:SAG11_NODE_38173_length_253_cov_1.012987_1_plen_37_part_01
MKCGSAGVRERVRERGGGEISRQLDGLSQPLSSLSLS